MAFVAAGSTIMQVLEMVPCEVRYAARDDSRITLHVGSNRTDLFYTLSLCPTANSPGISRRRNSKHALRWIVCWTHANREHSTTTDAEQWWQYQQQPREYSGVSISLFL
jgi:hypothetical protein